MAIRVKFKKQEVKADADKWITVHPHSGKGSPALIGENGEIKAGMGGKFNGKHISEAKGSGQKQDAPKENKMPDGHHKLSRGQDLFVAKETDKAYGLNNPAYIGTGYYARHRWAKGEDVSTEKYIWIPKSQASVEQGESGKYISSVTPFIAERAGLQTEEGKKKQEEISAIEQKQFSDASDKYNALIQHAKKHGLTGVRVGMRTSTILEKMKGAGIQPPEEKQSPAKMDYVQIPGRGHKGILLKVPFDNKDEAKAAGAKWSPDVKKWYWPEGADIPEGLKQYAK